LKLLITALAVAFIAFPASALAVPDDLRHSAGPFPSGSTAVPPRLTQLDHPTAPSVAPHLPAAGTDVAASDQQAPVSAASPTPAESDFDWTDAGIGGVAVSLLAISLAAGVTLRRRQAQRPSALAG